MAGSDRDWLVGLACLVWLGCSGNDVAVDASMLDAGVVDAVVFDASPPDASPAPIVELQRQFLLSGGMFAEVNLLMSRVASLACAFQTDGASLAWDVHEHADELIVHQSGTASNDSFFYEVANDGRFSAYWQNLNEAEVTLDIDCEFTGQVLLHSITSE